MTSDEKLQQSVIDELAWEPAVTSAHIGVTAKDGVVTLSGHVPSLWQKRLAEATVNRVRGVKAVVEEIDVQLFGYNLWTDDQIAGRALQNLSLDGSLPKDRIKLAVERGRITLTGEVDWDYQRRAAEGDVHRLTGVVGVTNEIKIKPHVQAYEVREKIGKALERVAPFDTANISIEADGGAVTLTGNLHNWYERDLVETAAWSVPGVTQVQDNISIT
jgi:osmotically-inducible protein OsmY